MVQVIKCDCNNRHKTNINSISSLDNINTYFEEQVKKNIFKEISVEKPFTLGSKAKKRNNILQVNGINIKFADVYGKLIIPIFLLKVLLENLKMIYTKRDTL